MSQYSVVAKLMTDVVLSESRTSAAFDIRNKKYVAIQYVWDGDPTANAFIEVSIDYNPATQVGTWAAIPGVVPSDPFQAPGSAFFAMPAPVVYPWIRIRFNWISGSGTMNATIVAKA